MDHVDLLILFTYFVGVAAGVGATLFVLRALRIDRERRAHAPQK